MKLYYQDMTHKLNQSIRECLGEICRNPGYGLETQEIILDHPVLESHGDYSTNIALRLSKELGKPAREIAEALVAELKKIKDPVWEKVEIAGPGFINFFLNKKVLGEEISQILSLGDDYGSSKEAAAIGKWDTVIVEYSSPNIAKPFGIGHLRSTIIGDSVQRLLKFQGYKVVTDNHLGDWGTQFGKLCYAIKTWGNEEKIWQSSEPIKELVRLYVRFHKEAKEEEETKHTATILDAGRAWFAQLENGDAEAKRLWKLSIEASMKEFMEIYNLLGVSFDLFLGESFFEHKLPGIVQFVKSSKYAKESEGATLIFYPEESLPPLMILKSDGSTLYATRDLATDQYRIAKWGEKTFIINETGQEQGLYWRQLYKAEEMLGIAMENQRYALLHGLMLSPGGKKFSTRKGDELWLKDVFAEAIDKAKKIMDERKIGSDLSKEENAKVAQLVAVGALKYNDLKQGHQRDIIFDWDKVINFDGDSGPYLQYTYARAKSVLWKAGERELTSELVNSLIRVKNQLTNQQINQLTPEEISILRYLYRFPEVVEAAARTYSPNLVCSYLFELAKRFNNFYNNVPILGPSLRSSSDDDRTVGLNSVTILGRNGFTVERVHGKSSTVNREPVSTSTTFRLTLTKATAQVLANGLRLLGIAALEKM